MQCIHQHLGEQQYQLPIPKQLFLSIYNTESLFFASSYTSSTVLPNLYATETSEGREITTTYTLYSFYNEIAIYNELLSLVLLKRLLYFVAVLGLFQHLLRNHYNQITFLYYLPASKTIFK